MRTPSDLPRRWPRASRRVRIGLLVGVVVLILLIVSLNGLARFWTDYLWFQSVKFTSVFRGVLLTKWLLALTFIAIFFVILDLIPACEVPTSHQSLRSSFSAGCRYFEQIFGAIDIARDPGKLEHYTRQPSCLCGSQMRQKAVIAEAKRKQIAR